MFTIRSRYLVPGEGWKLDEQKVADPGGFDALVTAGRKASEVAKDLDARFGDSHYWTVDLYDDENRSCVQLFHGRTS